MENTSRGTDKKGKKIWKEKRPSIGFSIKETNRHFYGRTDGGTDERTQLGKVILPILHYVPYEGRFPQNNRIRATQETEE